MNTARGRGASRAGAGFRRNDEETRRQQVVGLGPSSDELEPRETSRTSTTNDERTALPGRSPGHAETHGVAKEAEQPADGQSHAPTAPIPSDCHAKDQTRRTVRNCTPRRGLRREPGNRAGTVRSKSDTRID